MRQVDTLVEFRKLLEAGYTEQQAEAQVRLISNSIILDMGVLATKEDIERLSIATKADIERLSVATKEDINRLSIQTKADISQLSMETKADINRLSVETKADINRLSIETKADIKTLEKDIVSLEERINSKFNFVYMMGGAIFTVNCIPLLQKLFSH